MLSTDPTAPTTCTVVVIATGGRCGARVVHHLTARSGAIYGECAEHAAESAAAPTPEARPGHGTVLRTRSAAPFALVGAGRIVGYAYSRSPLVLRRAERVGAKVLPIVKGTVKL